MSDPIEAPGAEQSANLITGRSEVVHAPSPILPTEPLCSAGRKRDTRTHYRKVTAPVTCKNCGPDSALTTPPAVREAAAPSGAPRAERTPAPVVASAEFWPGLRLHNPHTGASYEVIEHTHAVRLRNLRTDSVVAIPQEMARELERLPSERAENRLDEIRAGHRREDAARFETALRDGIVAAVRTVEALTPLLLQFARDASAAAATLAEAFGVPHPNACALCGQGEGARDHWSGHDYRPPVDAIRLRRMQLRRTAGYPARERVRRAHQEHRAYLAVQRTRAEVRADRRTELERAGLTTVPFDQQRVQPDASAFSLPS